MPQAATLRVEGYREFMRALQLADKADRKAVRDELRTAAEHVRRDAGVRMLPIDERSAAGYRIRVRQRGVAVEQSKRKTTGKHPEFGALQMRRALLPAMTANEDELMREMEAALDRIAGMFNSGGRVF